MFHSLMASSKSCISFFLSGLRLIMFRLNGYRRNFSRACSREAFSVSLILACLN